jgi:hypothetical protein
MMPAERSKSRTPRFAVAVGLSSQRPAKPAMPATLPRPRLEPTVTGRICVRLVEYGAGYRADHWCAKGHIVHVIAGDLVIEHRDGRRFALGPGMSWHAPDDGGLPHRVLCDHGATVFIVD